MNISFIIFNNNDTKQTQKSTSNGVEITTITRYSENFSEAEKQVESAKNTSTTFYYLDQPIQVVDSATRLFFGAGILF